MVTIKEIAEMLDLSPTTVANVIHRKTSKVSKANVKRVEEALKAYNYVPRFSLDCLTKGSTRLIGVFIYTDKNFGPGIFSDPFYGMVIGVLEYAFRKAGYYMLLYVEEDPELIFQTALGWNIAGAIAITFSNRDYSKLKTLMGKPVVGIDTHDGVEMETYDVCIDDLDGGYQAVEYMLRQGIDNILMVAQSKKCSDAVRLRGYQKALRRHNIPYDKSKLFIFDDRDPKKTEKMKVLLRYADNNAGIFCVSDRLAIQVMETFQKSGFQIPKDISVVGYDDNIYARLSSPRLTTIHQDVQEKAEAAAEMLLRLISGGTPEYRHVMLPVNLVTRDSVKIMTIDGE
ncbi:MAG: LacI family transcriptional regulator [Lachnospiraceae bacterium]|nr:LacI family transcriptional regulator [Lachnospiraceae bacterium]